MLNTPNQKVPRRGRDGDSDAEGKWVEKRRDPLLGILPPWGVRHPNPHQVRLWLLQTTTRTPPPPAASHLDLIMQVALRTLAK